MPRVLPRTFITSADSCLTSDLIGALSGTLIFLDLKPNGTSDKRKSQFPCCG